MIRRIRNLNNYIANTAPEFFTALPVRLFRKGIRTFPAFEDPNYRIYFTGQSISLVGSWLQVVAQGWLVFELTHSAFWVGFVTALSSLPILFLAIIGGVMVDRFDTKKLLYITQFLPMLFAAILGSLTISGFVALWHIALMAFLLGVVNALDVPARQTFTAEMMERRRLSSAIVLNAAAFNGSRIIGPSFAGILIATIGTGGTFLVNAVSFIAVITSLYKIRVDASAPTQHPHPIVALKEGLRYTFARADLRLIMSIAALVSIFGWSYAAILPVIANDVFHQGATGLGYLYTAVGIGALSAILLVSLFLSRIGPTPFILGGNILVLISLFTFSFIENFSLGLFFMFLTGLGLLSQMSVMNATVQHSIEHSIRGRVMSIYVTMFRGTAPFGAFLIGYLGEYLGAQWAVRIMALALVATVLILTFKRRTIPRRLELTRAPHLTTRR